MGIDLGRRQAGPKKGANAKDNDLPATGETLGEMVSQGATGFGVKDTSGLVT
jgi:hypothetical protein